jgi:hypothetical protein
MVTRFGSRLQANDFVHGPTMGAGKMRSRSTTSSDCVAVALASRLAWLAHAGGGAAGRRVDRGDALAKG